MRVFEEIIKDISMLIDIKIKNINRDITFKATVIEKVSDTKYKILYKKQYHTAWCLAKLVIGSTVHVCAPGNDWSELFINQSCTRKEFEELKSDLTIALKYLGNLNECTDLNTPPADCGICLITGGAANSPNSNAGIMFYHTAGGSASSGTELAIFRASSGIYTRSRTSGTWSQWYTK